MSTQHFEPGAPEFAQALDEKVTNTQELVAALIKRMDTDKLIRPVMVPSGGSIDGAGNAQFLLYEVPAGMGLYIDQINLEVGGASTPAAPITTGFIGIYRGEPGFGGLLAFSPASGAGGPVAPVLLTDTGNTPPLLRGERLIVKAVGLPAGAFLQAIHALLMGRLVQL